MMPKDGRGLKKRLVGCDATVGPDVEDQLVIIGPLSDTCILDRILDAGDWRENGVNGDHSDWLVGVLVLVTGGKAAPDLDLELDVKLLLSVERADVLIGVDDLDSLRALDIGGGHRTLFRYRDGRGASFVVGRLEFHLLEIQDDIDDVFDHARQAGEFVGRTFDAHGGNRGPFERGKEDAAQGVAQRVAVAGLKRLGDEFCVDICGRDLVLDEGLRHLESSETNWHVF